jgi:catechol 1,2-dioxygenase
VPYSNTPSQAVDAVTAAATALGRSTYRPAHIHYEIHHPDLIKPYRGEVYFAGPYNTAVFDFVLKTRTSPDTAASPQRTT